jgi:hypothetical protein
VYAHHRCLSEKISALEAKRHAALRTSQEANIEKVRQLRHLKGIGSKGAWVLRMGFFGGREYKSRRVVCG